MKIYCEHGALTADLKTLQREGRIELVHFPYDQDSRARAIAPSAVPSDAQWRDLNTTWEELPGTWADYQESRHLPEIRRIIGPANRRDALHLDSAFKTGCAAMVTADRDILDHRDKLEALLGFRIFRPDERDALRRCIEQATT
jgi:hypothetical protein